MNNPEAHRDCRGPRDQSHETVTGDTAGGDASTGRGPGRTRLRFPNSSSRQIGGRRQLDSVVTGPSRFPLSKDSTRASDRDTRASDSTRASERQARALGVRATERLSSLSASLSGRLYQPSRACPGQRLGA